MNYDLTICADLCVDILFTGDVAPVYNQIEQFVSDYNVEIGGSAAIFASQVQNLGGNPCILGVIGDDPFGRIIIQRINDLSLNSDHIYLDKQLKTAVGLGLNKDGDRAMLTYLGSIAGVTEKRIRDSGVLDKSKHLHIASYFLLEQLQSFWLKELPRLKNQGITVSLDTNWSPGGNWEAVLDILEFVDVFIPNEQESLKISGKNTVEQAGKFLNSYSNMVVIKRGVQGSTVFKDGKHINYHLPEFLKKDLSIVDTTGAGDNFDAGFVWAWLKGMPINSCAELGMRCGTLSLSKIGGIDGQYREKTGEQIR